MPSSYIITSCCWISSCICIHICLF